ncbi:MAG: imidazole glycerol phosphate synthase subunit HisH [Bacteroidetes bacterium]|nr:imidazole glycerol phosphate synthase subunit HisH [Bacteroidota bacterium]
MITIIDYGAGNILSIKNMIKRIGGSCLITSDPIEIEKSKKLILPGVGNFDFGMNNLLKNNLVESLNNAVLQYKTPILGICLGAQLMCASSEEGIKDGLNWFNARVIKFEKEQLQSNQKIPHMGWNFLTLQKNSKLFEGFTDKRFYFVHSYHFLTHEASINLTKTIYGYEFVSAMERDNIFAVQFHPEKSHKYGMKLMENFINL